MIDGHEHDGAGWADGQRVPLANDHSWEQGLQEFCAEFGVNAATAFEMMAWFEERNGESRSAGRSGAHLTPALSPLLSESQRGEGARADAAGGRGTGPDFALRTPHSALALEAARAVDGKCRQGFNVLVAYMQQQGGAADMLMAARAMALVLGYKSAAGAEHAGDLARKLNRHKATVNKCVNVMLEKMGLPLLEGQRDARGRRNMKRAREKQLKRGTAGA